jgi:hypothetical protein
MTTKTVVVTLVALVAIVTSAFGAKAFLDSEHQSVATANLEREAIELAAETQKVSLELKLAQSTAALQSGVNANQLQLIQFELNDINGRIGTKDERKEDRSRKLILGARIKALALK